MDESHYCSVISVYLLCFVYHLNDVIGVVMVTTHLKNGCALQADSFHTVCSVRSLDDVTHDVMIVSCRLARFMEKALCVLHYFEPYLGRIEIMGSAQRIERVYFEIKQSHVDQWEKPQIKVRF